MNATAKPRYERPTLLVHRSGLMNKMGGAPALRPTTDIDGVPVDELITAYGSPCFVYSERVLRERARSLKDAFTRRWPRVQVAWSYKTMYLDAVCRIFHDEGAWAEVVSGMELRKAQRNGVPLDQVVFNGPHKDPAALEAALLGGSKIHVDHYDELAQIEAIATKHDLRPNVGLRLNVDTGTQPRWDRFGFHLDSGQAWDAVRRMVGGGIVRIEGLHCHLGTYVQDTGAYREAAAKIARFANRLRSELGIEIAYVDVGGGFASSSQLKGQYLPSEQTTPSFAQYAEAITDGLAALDAPPEALPLLILETGRALVDDAGWLITSVVANKRLADGRRAMVVDAGVNLLFTAYWYTHKLVPAKAVSGVPEPTVVYGPLCMNIDVVNDKALLPPMEPGDPLVIHPVGAYNVTQSMQFIELRPAVALVGVNGEHGLIRRAEILDDLTRPEMVPAWLETA